MMCVLFTIKTRFVFSSLFLFVASHGYGEGLPVLNSGIKDEINQQAVSKYGEPIFATQSRQFNFSEVEQKQGRWLTDHWHSAAVDRSYSGISISRNGMMQGPLESSTIRPFFCSSD